MIHLSILTLIFAFAAGAVAITISALSYRQSRSAHIIPHIYLIGSVNLIIIINISSLYFYQNLSSEASVATVLMIDRAYQILMPAFQILAVCSLRNLELMLIGGRQSSHRLRRCVWFAVGIGVIQVIFTLWHLNIAELPVLYLIHRVVEGLALVAAYGILGFLIAGAGRARPVAKRKLIRIYAILLVTILTLAILANLLSWLGRISPEFFASIAAGLVLLANLIPVLYYQRFLLPRFAQIDASQPAVGPISDLRAQFDISAREQEVLELICSGHTNQEIADMLFISHQTVKDHVSRIFRKAGVKNRVQLIALLGGSDRDNPEDT